MLKILLTLTGTPKGNMQEDAVGFGKGGGLLESPSILGKIFSLLLNSPDLHYSITSVLGAFVPVIFS